MGKLSRTKGMRFENERAKWWRDMGWTKARRKLSQYQETDGQDIENTDPWVEQCKVGKKINVLKAYKEAVSASSALQIPIASVKWDNQKTLIVMSEETFRGLLNKL